MDELTHKFGRLLSENRAIFGDDKIRELLKSHMREQNLIKEAQKLYPDTKSKVVVGRRWWKLAAVVVVLAVAMSVVIMPEEWEDLATMITTTDCLLYNNVFMMEMSRPVFDCNICRNITSIPVVSGISKEEFVAKYAYSSVPVLVKHATVNWTAMGTFTFEYFRKLYLDADRKLKEKDEEMKMNAIKEMGEEYSEEYNPEDEGISDDGYDDEITEDDGLACQFFPYKTEFRSLIEAMNMSEDRANFKEGEQTWYFGWSNCNAEIQTELRRHYERPYFLPDGSETSSIDWMFMGGKGRGAPMHLDSVSRPSWQAQISGRKTWSVEPPPECQSECSNMEANLEQGDIIVIDTNVWYHGTFVHPGAVSICIGSEYD